MINLDEIRQKVAIEHNVLLGSDDPILIAVTLNEHVLGHYIEQVDQKHEALSRELTLSFEQHNQQAKETAERLVTSSSEYVTQEIKMAVSSAISEALPEIKKQIADTQASVRQSTIDADRTSTAFTGAKLAAIVAIASAVVSVAVTITVLVTST